MRIIKEFCPESKTIVIRSDCYGSQLDYIMTLFHEAQKDFPGLDYKDVTIVHYAGERHKRTFGIEIEIEAGFIPENYVHINQLEYTL